MPGEFANSNVLLYLTSDDPAKALVAERLLRGELTVSVQVLNEIANVARRKFGRHWTEIAEFLDRLRPNLSIQPITEAMHVDALRIAQRYRLSWWDALIVAAALAVGCDTLYSEDMQAGLVIDGALTIVNPFA